MPNPIDVHVGQKVREARIAKGWTQTELGDAIKVSFQQVQKYERGSNRIGASRLWMICDVLDRPIEYFFEGLAGARNVTVEEAFSKDAIRIAKAIDQVDDRSVRKNFVQLVESYGSK